MRATFRLLPSIWASYLINGDASSLPESDRRQADDFLTLFRLPAPVSCEPDGFCVAGWNDAADLGGAAYLAQDCSRYGFLVDGDDDGGTDSGDDRDTATEAVARDRESAPHDAGDYRRGPDDGEDYGIARSYWA
jgi:hypothetical protein